MGLMAAREESTARTVTAAQGESVGRVGRRPIAGSGSVRRPASRSAAASAPKTPRLVRWTRIVLLSMHRGQDRRSARRWLAHAVRQPDASQAAAPTSTALRAKAAVAITIVPRRLARSAPRVRSTSLAPLVIAPARHARRTQIARMRASRARATACPERALACRCDVRGPGDALAEPHVATAGACAPPAERPTEGQPVLTTRLHIRLALTGIVLGLATSVGACSGGGACNGGTCSSGFVCIAGGSCAEDCSSDGGAKCTSGKTCQITGSYCVVPGCSAAPVMACLPSG